MSFCFIYNVVSENNSVQNSPWGRVVYSQLKVLNMHFFIWILCEKKIPLLQPPASLPPQNNNNNNNNNSDLASL